jgi:hypothetical protein
MKSLHKKRNVIVIANIGYLLSDYSTRDESYPKGLPTWSSISLGREIADLSAPTLHSCSCQEKNQVVFTDLVRLAAVFLVVADLLLDVRFDAVVRVDVFFFAVEARAVVFFALPAEVVVDQVLLVVVPSPVLASLVDLAALFVLVVPSC